MIPDDEIAAIRARHEAVEAWLAAGYQMDLSLGRPSHRDRGILLTENDELRAEVERLLGALAFYAEDKNWQSAPAVEGDVTETSACGVKQRPGERLPKAVVDAGVVAARAIYRARAALSLLQSGGEHGG